MSNKSINTFQKGMVRIDNPTKQPDNTYSFGLNLVSNNNILDNTSRSNEKGFDDFLNLKEVDYNIIGYQWLGSNEYVFFIKHIEDETPFNEIRYVNKDKNINNLIYSNLALNFKDNKEITSTYRINYKNQRVIYWVDGLNDDRVINIDDPNVGSLDISLLSIESSSSRPIVSAKVSDTGGTVTAGQYFISISYNLGSTFTTNPLVISNPISIGAESYFIDVPVTKDTTRQFGATDGDIIPNPTSKSIIIDISNIDENFDSYNILIIKPNVDGFIIKKIKEISTSSTNFIYTGGEGEIDDTIDIGNVIVDAIRYYASEAITQKSNRLLRGNSKLKGANLDFQSFANNIKVNYIINEEKVYEATNIANGYFSDLSFLSNRGSVSPSYLANTANDNPDNKTFMRDEVYSLGIGFELIDGSETDIYHIPGRVHNDVGTTGLGEYNRSVITNGFQWDTQLISGQPYWKERNTATNTGKLGYWRSDITYKDGFDLPTDGEKNLDNKSYIRHHKMPSDILEPIFRTVVDGSGNTIYKRNLSLTFSNIVIPDNFKNLISKIKFFYTPREGANKSILTKGMGLIVDGETNISRPNHFNAGFGASDSRKIFEFVSPDVNFKFKEANISGNKMKVCGIDKGVLTYMAQGTPQGNKTWLRYFNNDLYNETQRQQSLVSAFGTYNLRAIPKEALYSRTIKSLAYVDGNYSGSVSDVNVNFAGGEETSLLQINDPLILKPIGEPTPLSTYYPELMYPAGSNNPVVLYPNSIRYLNYGFVYDNNYDRMALAGHGIYDTQTTFWDTAYYMSIISINTRLYGYLEQLTYIPINNAVLYDNVTDILSQTITGGDTFIDSHHFKRVRISLTPTGSGTENQPSAINVEGAYRDSDEGQPANMITRINEDAAQSYGSYICETDINIKMRNEGTEPLQKYYPKSFYAFNNFKNIQKRANNPEYNNIDSSYLKNYIKLYFAYSSNESNAVSASDIRYSTRIIYSEKQELEDKIDNYRTVKANNYRDLPLNRGPIGMFFVKQDKLYAITRDSLFDVFASNQTIKSENEDNIVVGTGEFLSIEPTELIAIEGGFGGSSSKMSLAETPYGYAFVDKLKNKILLFNDQLKDINILGLNESFELELYKQFPELLEKDDIYDDPVKGVGILCIYDPKLNRLLVTKRDYKALASVLDNYQGIYNPLTSYNVGDIVTYNQTLVEINEGESEIEIINTSNFSDWIIDNTNQSTNNILIITNGTNGTASSPTQTSIDYILDIGETSDSFTINQSGDTCSSEEVNITKDVYAVKWVVDDSTAYCEETIDTFTYSVDFGIDPMVWNGLIVTKNTVETNRIDFESTGDLNGEFIKGNVIGIRQFSYDDIWPWSPNSSARLRVEVNDIEVYNEVVTVQTTELQSYDIISDNTTNKIAVFLTGTSTQPNEFTKIVTTNNEFAQDLVEFKIIDSIDSIVKLNLKPKTGNGSEYGFNVVGTTGTLTVEATNNHLTDSQDWSIFDGVTTHNFTIPSGVTHNFTGLNKDSLIIDTTIV